MVSSLFLSYRRSGDAGYTQALLGELKKSFSSNDIFMDVKGHIKPGEVFETVINRFINSCDIMLVVIGPSWQSEFSRRRESEQDYVEMEIRQALELKKIIIPVLVGGAEMPRRSDIPLSIGELAAFQSESLLPRSFEEDCDRFRAFLLSLDPIESLRAKTPSTTVTVASIDRTTQIDEIQKSEEAKPKRVDGKNSDNSKKTDNDQKLQLSKWSLKTPANISSGTYFLLIIASIVLMYLASLVITKTQCDLENLTLTELEECELNG